MKKMVSKVAKCRKGYTGLILRVSKVRDGTKLYHGICLDSNRVGHTWQSLQPEVIGTIDDWVKLRYTELED